jgi:hypothetical protein
MPLSNWKLIIKFSYKGAYIYPQLLIARNCKKIITFQLDLAFGIGLKGCCNIYEMELFWKEKTQQSLKVEPWNNETYDATARATWQLLTGSNLVKKGYLFIYWTPSQQSA